MTNTYTHQGLSARPLTSPEAMKLQWSHSVIHERNYLNEWQAQEHASTLAAEMGSSVLLRVDSISFPLRRCSKSQQVRFNDDVMVFIGEDCGFDLRPMTITHHALQDFDDKPWRLRSLRSNSPDDDATSLMARRPTRQARPPSFSSSSTPRSSSTSMSTSSSTTRSLDWRQTVLILLDGRMLSIRIPWDDGDQLVRSICTAIGTDPGRSLYGVHYVSHRPADLIQQGLQCLLLQTDLEPRPSPLLRLVMVDLEIFEPNEVLPGAFRRFSKWLPETINRISVFRLLGLESLLVAHPDRSRLWYNNVPVNEHQVSPLHLQDGDFLHVLIGDHIDGFACMSTSPTSFQENVTEEDDDFSGFQAYASAAMPDPIKIESAVDDPLSNVALCISGIDPRLCGPVALSANEPFSFFQSAADSPRSDHDGALFAHPPRVEQPIWQHEIWDLLRAHGETELHEEGPIIYVTSHYISHTMVPRNTITRPLRFDIDHETWEASVRFMWEDYIDNGAAIEIFIVRPALPTTVYQGTIATVVATQHPQPARAACVLSTAVAGQSHLHNSQVAYSAAFLTPPAELIEVSGASPRCLPVHTLLPPCQLWLGEQPLPLDADVRVHDGLGLQIVIPEERITDIIDNALPTNAALLQAPLMDQEDDEAVLLHVAQQVPLSPPSISWDDSIGCDLSESTKCGIDIPSSIDETNFYEQTSTTLVQPVLQWSPDMPDPFIEDLAGLWELLAFAWEDEPRSGTVLVWFVDHQWQEPHCLAPRPVQLYPAIADWRRRIWQAWADEIVLGATLDFHLVIPKPPTVDHRIIAHVLLVQRPQPQWATMVLSVFDARPPDFEVRQIAITMAARISLDDLLQVLGIYRECTATPPTLRCMAWHHDVTLQPGVPFHAHSGISLLMRLFEPPQQPPQLQPLPMDVDENANLQLSTRHQLTLDALIPEPPRILVDFTAAAQAYYALLSLQFTFLENWPEDVILPDETIAALGAMQNFEDAQPVQAFHFYVDGSKVAGHGVGVATACLLETDTGYALAGILPVHVAFAEHAYIGEHAAMANALIWAVHMSTWHLQRFPTQPVTFHFHFDAMNTGYQAAGWWRAHEYKEWQALFRSLAHILEHRHGARQLTWQHVRAHAQHPWNEMVDRFAKFASMNPGRVGDCESWHRWLNDPPMLNALQWIWYLELMRANVPTAAPMHGLLLVHPLQAPTSAAEPLTPPPAPEVDVLEFKINLKLATANVLTLSADPASKSTSITRQQILMRQFHEAGCHVIGLQETRHRHLQDLANPYYHVVGAPATHTGHDGVQLWISKVLPFCDGGLPIHSNHIQIVAAHATYLIVKVNTAAWRCIFVTARAPHSGHGLRISEEFWHCVSKHIRQLSCDWPIFFLGDTNGHLGDTITAAVGALHGRQENDPGATFHQWMLEHQLFAPATFPQYHTGRLDYTYVAPDGEHSTRIDYIALPQALHYDSIQTWVDEDVDISTQRIDHLPVICHIVLKAFRPAVKLAPRSGLRAMGSDQSFCRALHDPEHFHALRDGIHLPPWHADPHCTADALASQTRQTIQRICPSSRRQPRKTHLSEATWHLICVKKSLFKQLRALKRTRIFTILQVLFRAWRHPHTADDARTWMKLNDHAYAMTMCKLKKVTFQVTAAVRDEDAKHYMMLAERAARTYTVEGLTALWRQIKAVLPKHRLRRSVQRYDLGEAMLQHFEQLEAGTTFPVQEIRKRCLSRNASNVAKQPPVTYVDLSELPTLAETEDLCLRQSPNKAPGHDGLSSNVCRYGAAALSPHLHGVMLKAFLSAMEPCRYKGGFLVPIWKQKGPQTQAASYRGILLSESYGKVYHAWLRRRLLPTMLQRRALGQLGGLPSQQTASGIQMLRLHGRLGRAHKISTAVIFVDLRSAFHHLLREFVFNDDSPMSFDELGRVLDPMDFDLTTLAAELCSATQQIPTDVPPALRRCLADVHRHTWFQLQHHDDVMTETRRGTRPGSPLADIGFNLLMADLVKQLHEQLLQCQVYCQGQAALGLQVPPITWVDDLAVPMATNQPDQLKPLVQEVTSTLHTLFLRYGLSLNMQKGKTEAVMMFRGKNANRCRSALFDADSPPTLVSATSTHVLSIRVVPSYRHLGARYTMDLDIDEEINNRIGMAKQAYAELKRAIFSNRALAATARVQLYESLVLTRLLYGCSVWSDVPAPLVKQIETMIIKHHRSIYNCGFWTDDGISDEAFIATNQVMPFRLHWARHRLVYLQHIARHGLPVQIQLLLAEYATGKGWLHEVSRELAWMATLVELPFELPTTAAMWQDLWPVLAAWKPWKPAVRRACKKHLLQEKLAWEVKSYHTSIVRELELHGGEIGSEQAVLEENVASFHCHACTHSFPTYQQLALHAFRQHGVVAQERHYVQSTVCPGCLRDYHTTFRVTQHLRYRRNGCWDRTYMARSPDEPVTIDLPEHLRKVKRLPAVRRHLGPLRPTSIQRMRIKLRQDIIALRAEGKPEFAWWYPNDEELIVQHANVALREALLEWTRMDCPNEVDFQNLMFGALFTLEVEDPQRCRLFMHWVEKHMYDDCPADMDPDHAILLERAYVSMLEDLPTWQIRQKMKELTDRWMHLPPDYPDFGPPSTPVTRRPYDRVHCIPSEYQMMASAEMTRRGWVFHTKPPMRSVSQVGPYYLVHLYSGRRRDQDFQFWMEKYLNEHHPSLCGCTYVLSIDTAIHHTMNIHSPALWNHLLDYARAGRLLAILLGPPCETWSAARCHSLPEGERKGPRPLRTAEELWGLPLRRTMAELLQLSVGNCLLLKGIWLSVAVTYHSGSAALEHPAMPYDEELPSIWRSGVLRLLLRGGAPFRRVTIHQWRFGAEGVKPTMLSYSNGSLPSALQRCEIPDAIKPTVALLGRDEEGRFRTAKAKEYPSALSKAFALFFSDRLTRLNIKGCPQEADAEIFDFVALAACLDSGSMMPDYQPV